MAQNDSSPVLIVGAGHAAGVLARALRDEGLVGAITVVGEDGSLVFATGARSNSRLNPGAP